jgi:hypothetical protein
VRHNYLPVRVPEFPSGRWSVSSRCGPNGGNCVEVNLALQNVVGVRDGKHPDEGDLVFGSEVWRAFLAAARVGRFDR